MGLASSARYNSAATNAAYALVPAVDVRLLDTGYFEVVGACGHRLTVVRPGHEEQAWRQRIADQKRHRMRCTYCPKDTQ